MHAEWIEAEAPSRRLGQKDVPVVRRIERAAEQAGAAHASSNVSSPTSTSAPLRAPAARSACVELRVVRRRSGDAEAAIGAQNAVAALATRPRTVDEEVDQLRLALRRLGSGRYMLEEPTLEARRRPPRSTAESS